MPRPSEQPYAVLQLKPGASMHEVRLAYRHLSVQGQPDRFPGDPARQEQARVRLQQLREAYEAICDARGADEDNAAQARVESGVRVVPWKRAGWRIPAGIVVALALVSAAVIFPPMPAKVESIREISTMTATAPASASASAPRIETAAGTQTPLPWNVVVEPPSAPLTDAVETVAVTNADATASKIIWVPASTNAAAAGMSWSLTPPGLRPRAVPASSGGASNP